MLNAQLNTVQWISLPITTRMRLVQLFNIPRSSGSLVQDNKVISDGYTHNDLLHISVEKMQKLLDTDEKDFFVLFEQVVKTLEQPTAVQEIIEPKPQTFSFPWIGEMPKDLTLNIGGEEYVLVKKTERLGIVKSEDLKQIINGDDKPKVTRKKTRGRPRKK